MDLVIYLGCKVYITLKNSYYYQGKVLDADEESITVLDKNSNRISLTKDSILTIREVKNGSY